MERYFSGEDPESICASLGKTTRWLYNWVSRHTPDDPAWFKDHSRQPLRSPYRTPVEIEKIVEMVRLNLYNKGLFCGNRAIQWEMSDMEVQPIPSLSTIGRIFCRRELTHRRIERYTPKGKKYPEFPALSPNQTHQVDMVGPCYLTGPIRFYSLHAIETLVMEHAIRNATDSDIALLKENICMARQKVEHVTPAFHENIDFHILLAKASANSVFAIVVEALMTIVSDFLGRIPQAFEMSGRVYQEHEVILRAVIEKETLQAQNLMDGHLRSIHDRFKESFETIARGGWA